ncbi:hypothetical protein O9929_02655 [Vibrio lentus]|nr:hypothetical protein [Vibrio lentus]
MSKAASFDEEVKDGIAKSQPYEKWVEENLLSLEKATGCEQRLNQPSPEKLHKTTIVWCEL